MILIKYLTIFDSLVLMGIKYRRKRTIGRIKPFLSLEVHHKKISPWDKHSCYVFVPMESPCYNLCSCGPIDGSFLAPSFFCLLSSCFFFLHEDLCFSHLFSCSFFWFAKGLLSPNILCILCYHSTRCT